MKVLFYPIYNETPHLETELELILNHLEMGDEILVMQCRGELKTCFFNPKHQKSLCILCQDRVNRGVNLIRHKNLKKIAYPEMSIDYNILPKQFENIDELKRYEIDNVSIGLAAASSLISRLNREHMLDTLRYKQDVFTELSTSYFLALVFEKWIIPNIKPDLVYIFNGRISTTAPAVDACKKLGVNFKIHERGGHLGSYWLGKNAIPHDLEYVSEEIEILWNDCSDDKFEKGSRFFVDRKNRVIQSWYSFTNEQKRSLLPLDFNKQKKNIVIYNSTIEEFAAVKGWQKPLFLFEDEIDALIKILNYFQYDLTKHFYLRVHPNLKGYINTQTTRLYDLDGSYSNFSIIRPESLIDSYALLDASDLIITFGSTIGIEATFWGKPSINLGMAFYNQVNGVYIPKSINELFTLISSDLLPKDKVGALKYGFWELNRGKSFKYFKQFSLTQGEFFDVNVCGRKPLIYYLLRIFEILRKAMEKIFKTHS